MFRSDHLQLMWDRDNSSFHILFVSGFILSFCLESIKVIVILTQEFDMTDKEVESFQDN